MEQFYNLIFTEWSSSARHFGNHQRRNLVLRFHTPEKGRIQSLSPGLLVQANEGARKETCVWTGRGNYKTNANITAYLFTSSNVQMPVKNPH